MNILSTYNPTVLYHICLNYIFIYQKKVKILDKYLDNIINYFKNSLINIINMFINDISNVNNKLLYMKYRNIYVNKFINKIYLNYNYNTNDTISIKNNKYLNSYILFNLHYDKIDQIKKYNDCIIFLDKLINTLPSTNYIIKGNLIQNNEIIYSNVCEVVIVDEDDISRLPPKKRYRKI